MSKIKNCLSYRVVAVFLSLLMVLSISPLSVISVFAATEKHPNAVTITVTDEDGFAIEGASISFIIDSKINGDNYIAKTEKTDTNGCVEVLSSTEYIEDDFTITATVSKTGYKTDDTSIVDLEITNSEQNFNVDLVSTIITDVVISGQDFTFDNKWHNAVSVVKQENDIVLYEYDCEGVEELPNGEPQVKEVGTYKFKVTVSRDGFDSYIKEVTTIVEKADITDITLIGNSLNYNEKLQNLVTVSGINEDTDTVSYTVNGEEVSVLPGKVPTAQAIGNYIVKLTVDRGKNYNVFEEEVTSNIANGVLELGDLKIKGLEGVYTGLEQDAVEVSGQGDYNLQYKLDGGEWIDNKIPKVTNAGSYIVSVKATKASYDEKNVDVEKAYSAELPFNVYIAKAYQEISFTDTKYVDGQNTEIVLDENNPEKNIYDFSATGGNTENDIVYSIKNSSNDGIEIEKIAVIDSATGMLTVKSAGCITITATKHGNNNYNSVSIIHNVTISVPDNGLISFDATQINYIFGETDGIVSDNSVKVKNADDKGEIKYTIDKNDIGISCDTNSGEIKIENYNTLNEILEDNNGDVKVKVTATKSPYTVTSENLQKPIQPQNTYAVYFSNANNWDNVYIHYWGGSSTTSWPGVEMTPLMDNIHGQKVYRFYVPNDVQGIVFNNGNNGKQTVNIESSIYNRVNFYPNSYDKNDTCSVESVPWTIDDPYEKVNVTTTKYGESSSSYTINISYAEKSEESYLLEGTVGDNEWYKSAVTVKPKDAINYTISKGVNPDSFSDNVVYSEEGTADRYVYLRTASGGITSKIKLEGLKIDTIAPDANNMSIEFSDLTPIQKIGKWFGFYNPDVKITFTVNDETGDSESGVQYIDWTYTKDADATSSILGTKTERLIATKDDGKYVANLTLTASEAEQYRGNISFTATDIAGNKSAVKSENTIIVIDTINPKMTASHQIVDENDAYNPVNNQHYYSGDVLFTFVVKEANFFEEDFKVKMSKDEATEQDVSVDWIHDDEVYTGTFVISGDGDYKVSTTYKDQSGNIVTDSVNNEIVHYESDIITIDTTPAIVECSVADKDSQFTEFTVNEHNFRPEDITVTGTIKDINGNDISFTVDELTTILRNATWSTNGDTHKFIYDYKNSSLYYDGIYDLKIDYKNIVGNYTSVYEPEVFTIDHSKPSDVEFGYAKSALDTFLEVITLGFYNPSVTVKFTAYDSYSGIDYFTWNYTQQQGTSDVNRPTDLSENTVKAVQDTVDKSKFTATVTLPDNEYKQLRGYIAAYATDTYNNVGKKLTDDGNIIVVDTIAPTIKVEYSPASRTVGDTAYYNDNVQVTFNVNEANFFAEDVKVKVIKNGATAYEITPDWYDESVDEHIGTYTLTGDGHYIVTVEYIDRSNNEMAKYVSSVKTIDTIKPEIDVTYQNKNIINTLNDSENHSRSYFDDVQTAVITVKEHNFNADEVDFSIVGKDVTGTEIYLDNLISKSTWSDNGDVHTITIKYSGDANYTFDVDYTDLATNKVDDYKTDYFTVDKTAPSNLTVSYSTSVLETALENISFGFYNAKTTVTITADDQTSRINNFTYSYIKAANVSDVNAQLLEQAIKEAGITYSNNNERATTTFEIPKEVLQSNNQFNGTVEFTAQDRSGNSTDEKDNHRVVVDNISPTATVEYNQPVNEENGVSYYDGNIQGTITINEANFYSEDVSVIASKDGGAAYSLTTSWSDNSVDVHTGTFVLTEDGDYVVTVSYKDKSGNEMNTYKSNQLTIDTQIEEPVIIFNGNEETGKAYKNDVVPAISFQDENFSDYEVVLTRTRYGNKNIDVTDTFIGNSITVDNKGGSGLFDKFEKVAENDGIYKLAVKITDKAGHSSESVADFTVNRFGSVYEYSDYLVSLIKDGGAYVSAVDTDLVIIEYNADRLVNDSLNIEITKDGKPISDVKYDVSPALNDKAKVGESGWYQYEYTISKENFASDGVYKMSVSSKDATGNSPENTNYEDKDILFRVDSSAPEITSIVGLETSIINAQEAPVKYTIYDTIGLKSVQIFVDDKQVGDKITDFSSDMNNYSGSFVINESNAEQKVRFVVEDLAGNVTDTDSDTFTSAYAFERAVTVSTNIFVRWYANKLLFWGSIGGVVVLAGAISLLVIKKSKNKKTSK